MNQCNYKNILKKWDLEFNKERHDLDISGSPERTDYRVVIQDLNNDLFILEKINEDQYKHKMMINKTLQYLNKKGVNLKLIRQKIGLVFQYPENQLFEETIYRVV